MKNLTRLIMYKMTAVLSFSALFLLSAVAQAGVDIQTWKTSQGTKVLFVESKQLPMLDIEITFDAGSSRDGKVLGLASMTSTLLGTATKTKNEDQVAQGFDELGAQIGSGVNRDSGTVSLRTLTRPQIMQPALDLFAEVLREPKFEEAIFKRELERLKIALKQRASQAQSVSSDLLWQTLYAGHPYAHNPSGTLESIEQFDLQKVTAFFEKHYTASNATIAMVGNVSKAEAKEIAENITQGLNKGNKLAAIPAPKKLQKQEVTKEFDSSQTYYSLAQIGVKRGQEDYIPLFVGNHLFGGSGFASMLMEEVREKRGLVYSVYSYFAPMRTNGPFIIGLSTKNASALDADKVVKQTLTDFLNGFDDKTLQAIKDNLVGGFPLRIDSNSKILGYISMIGFYDMPLDYLEWFPQEVEKVTKQDILNAWNKHIDAQQMVRVMLGKPE